MKTKTKNNNNEVILSSKTALDISIKNEAPYQFKRINEKVRLATFRGKTYITVDFNLCKDVKANLISKGYKVDDLNGIISWELETEK